MSNDVYDEHPMMFRANPVLFSFFVALIALFGVGVLLLAGWRIWNSGTRVVANRDEIAYETGILSKTKVRIKTDRIRTVRLDQSFLQRITGTGVVAIYAAGDEPELMVSGLPDPARLVRVLSSSRGL